MNKDLESLKITVANTMGANDNPAKEVICFILREDGKVDLHAHASPMAMAYAGCLLTSAAARTFQD